jgi:hypothetical protein
VEETGGAGGEAGAEFHGPDCTELFLAAGVEFSAGDPRIEAAISRGVPRIRIG